MASRDVKAKTLRDAIVRMVDRKGAEVAALSLCGDQGITDFVAHSIENASRVLAAENFDALDRYRKGDVTAYLGLHVRTTNDEYCLAFFRVRSFSENGGVIRGGTVSRLERDGSLKGYPWCSEIEGNETAVFLNVSDLGEFPEGIIPSL